MWLVDWYGTAPGVTSEDGQHRAALLGLSDDDEVVGAARRWTRRVGEKGQRGEMRENGEGW